MACNTLTSITKDCGINNGGIREVYFLKLSDITTLEYTDYEVTDMVTSVSFVKYDMPLNSATYNVDYSTDEFGIQEFIHSLNIRISKRRPVAHTSLKSFIEGNPDIVALIKNSNNMWVLLGYENGLNIPNGGGGSGTTKADGTNYEFNLTGIEKDFEIFVPQDIVDTLI